MLNSIHKLFLWGLIVTPISLMAQKDTIQEIEAVDVSISIKKLKKASLYSPATFLTSEDVKELSAQDVGELLSKLSGVNLKSYGGLGGLKTIDIRSLGGEHTSTIIDGNVQSNSQTGQINFGQIQPDNIVGVIASEGSRLNLLYPVSSQIAGNSIIIQTFENTFSNDSLQLRCGLKYGSFEQVDANLSAKYSRNKFFVGGFGKYRKSVGTYPYQIQNANGLASARRANNSYLDYYLGGAIGIRLTPHVKFRVGYKQSSIIQELPGAVIYYNDSADETLASESKSVFADGLFSYEKWSGRLYSSASKQSLNYKDPDYLNNNGGIDNSFFNDNINIGFTNYWSINRILTINGGIEETFSRLNSNDNSFYNPSRKHTIGLLGLGVKLPFGHVSGQLSTQYLSESREQLSAIEDVFALSPFVSFSSISLTKLDIHHKLWYRNSLRMPTFNELYYNGIGNLYLNPEKAHQVNYSFDINPSRQRFNLFIRTNIFYNRIEDKIVAIPTKNLFVWSIQNVGRVNIYGIEVMMDHSWDVSENWKLSTRANYTYQSSLDATPESLNFGSQIAYMPEHMANADIALYYKKVGIRFSNNFVSMRYSLNENIEANEVSGFFNSDVSIFYSQSIGRRNELKLQLNIKNVFNQSYAYVRSYVMPGRNYLISLNYAFN